MSRDKSKNGRVGLRSNTDPEKQKEDRVNETHRDENGDKVEDGSLTCCSQQPPYSGE